MTNQVLLAGRLSRRPEEKSLPSGDTVWLLRLVLPRVDGRKSVDWVDCAVWSGRLRRSVAGWSEGDDVEIEGSLRRRFFKAGEASVTRLEVEATAGRLIRRAVPA